MKQIVLSRFEIRDFHFDFEPNLNFRFPRIPKSQNANTNMAKQVDEDVIVQTLGGSTYALRKSPTSPWTDSLFTIAMAPIFIPFGLLYAVAMATPLRNFLLSMVIPRIMENTARDFSEDRKILLKDVSGRVMDFGRLVPKTRRKEGCHHGHFLIFFSPLFESGGGAYLEYCTNADDVVAVEPIAEMHPRILEKGEKLKKMSIVDSLDDFEPSESFDWVTLGNVLCEVNDVRTVLAQIDGLLKPGGKVYFSEHIACPAHSWSRWYQYRINPM